MYQKQLTEKGIESSVFTQACCGLLRSWDIDMSTVIDVWRTSWQPIKKPPSLLISGLKLFTKLNEVESRDKTLMKLSTAVVTDTVMNDSSIQVTIQNYTKIRDNIKDYYSQRENDLHWNVAEVTQLRKGSPWTQAKHCYLLVCS